MILHASTATHEIWQGPKRYIRVIIHDTTEELQKAAKRYSGHDHVEDKTWACFQPCKQRLLVSKNKTVNLTKHYAGIMRLSREHFDTRIIVHECLHAAAHIYRMDCHTQVHLGDTCNYREEYLAHILDDLFNGVENALHNAGFETFWNDKL